MNGPTDLLHPSPAPHFETGDIHSKIGRNFRIGFTTVAETVRAALGK